MLVLNAGIGCLIKVSDLNDLTPYKQTMDINYWGYVYPAFYALPHLRERSGTIIVVSSLAGKRSNFQNSNFNLKNTNEFIRSLSNPS